MAASISAEVGQMSLQIDRLAVGAEAERLVFHVDIHGAGDGEGDDERRRHEEVRLDGLVDAGLEVPVS